MGNTTQRDRDELVESDRMYNLERQGEIAARQRETDRRVREQIAIQTAIDRQAHINRTVVNIEQRVRTAARSGRHVDLVQLQQELNAAVRGPLPDGVVTMAAQPAEMKDAEALVKALADAYMKSHPGTTYALARHRVLAAPENSALAAAYHGRSRASGPQEDAWLKWQAKTAEARLTGRPIDESFEFEFESQLHLCTPESRAVFDEAKKVQRQEWEAVGRRISLADALRRVRQERPDLFAAARAAATPHSAVHPLS